MTRSLRYVSASALALLVVAASPALAAEVTYTINADGESEVTAGGLPNQGDLDGSAIGFITLNDGTGSGSTGSAIFNLTIALIDGTLSGHHIHQAPSTTTGPIVIDFGNPNTILTGTPTAGTLNGTITGLPATTITNVFNNPSGFYYNLHSTPNFPGGAVRAQLPEPSSLALIAVAGLAAAARRRRRSVLSLTDSRRRHRGDHSR